MSDTTLSLTTAGRLGADNKRDGSSARSARSGASASRPGASEPKRKARTRHPSGVVPSRDSELAFRTGALLPGAEGISVDQYPIEILISDVATRGGNVVIATVTDQKSRMVLGVKAQYLRSRPTPVD
ncbi:MAG: hypothetical protein NTZ11_01805 [Gammaproteobacteria bacterium]|nr:hypothetical protein [Gammaproteobacteria bacterium]